MKEKVRQELTEILDEAIPKIESEKPPPDKPPDNPLNKLLILFATLFLLFFLLAAGAATYFLLPSADPIALDTTIPTGKILAPTQGKNVPRTFYITGETANIPPDHKIVLAVDVEHFRLCWPKKPFLKPNTK